MDMQSRERELGSDDDLLEDSEEARLLAGDAPGTEPDTSSTRLGGVLVGGALGAVAGVLVGGPPGAVVGGAVGAAAGAAISAPDETADAVTRGEEPPLYKDDTWAEMGEERRQ